MSPHVHVRDLRKRYGRVEAVRGVSFEVARGEVFGLLGPNGAGKTTTVDCLVGLREADDGDIRVGDFNMRRDAAAGRERIGVALQASALQDKITPREALRLFAAFYANASAPDALLERFGLVEKADAHFETLSGGQRQRLALALAFVNRPELVILDEPTSGLDPQARREVHREIARMKAEGHTVLLTTHYLEEAEQLCDRIAIVEAGRVLATGAPRELIARSNGAQTITVTTAVPLDQERVARLPGVMELAGEGATLRFRTAATAKTVAALMHLLEAERAELVDLQVRKATLEEVFLELTGRSRGAAGKTEAGEGRGGGR